MPGVVVTGDDGGAVMVVSVVCAKAGAVSMKPNSNPDASVIFFICAPRGLRKNSTAVFFKNSACRITGQVEHLF